jgi:nickel/cobalt transporter (NiCoT) family protein
VELAGLLGQELNLTHGFWGWIEGLNINTLGFFIVGLFVVTWAAAIGIWRAFGFEHRYASHTDLSEATE